MSHRNASLAKEKLRAVGVSGHEDRIPALLLGLALALRLIFLTMAPNIFNWDSRAVFRIAHMKASDTFLITADDYVNNNVLRQKLQSFITSHHPDVIIASPYGPIGKLWSVDNRDEVQISEFGIELRRRWTGQNWRVFDIVYDEK